MRLQWTLMLYGYEMVVLSKTLEIHFVANYLLISILYFLNIFCNLITAKHRYYRTLKRLWQNTVIYPIFTQNIPNSNF